MEVKWGITSAIHRLQESLRFSVTGEVLHSNLTELRVPIKLVELIEIFMIDTNRESSQVGICVIRYVFKIV
jgi:hypothetical protein